MNKTSLAWTGLLLVGLVVAAYMATSLGTKAGTVTFEFGWPGILAGGDGVLSSVISSLRIPRVIAAIITGGALALAGLLLQGVSRNPLADPFLLGISGGAGLAVVILHAIPGLAENAGWWLLPLVAFAGAQGATMLVLRLAKGSGGRVTVLGLILAGVIINSFCAAVTTFLLTTFAPLKLRITTMWLVGGVGHVDLGRLIVCGGILLASLVYLQVSASSLNALRLGEEGAQIVGVSSRKVLVRSAWVASLLTGAAVSMSGMVGYVGLIVPHLIRLALGGDFKRTIVPAALFGALMLLIGDTAARTVMSPQEIPVGVLAALIGTPLLLVLIRRELKGGR